MTDTPKRLPHAPPPEALFAAIVEHAPEAILVTTPGGEIIFINRAAEALLGYPLDEVVGRNIVMLVPPQSGRRAEPLKWLARWAAEPQGEQSRYLDFQARRRDGREMPVDVRVSSGTVDGQDRFFITVRDNTARRQEQVALKATNLRAARILLVAEDAIICCDTDQRITFFNLKAEAMFGYRAEEVLGLPLTVLLPPAARAGHPALVARFGAGAQASQMMSERPQVEGLRRSGETFPVEAAITKVAVGGAITYTAHVRDITERKRIEAGLIESERRFHAMFDHAVEAIALLAPDGTVLEFNRAARALTREGPGPGSVYLWDLPWLGAAEAGAGLAGRDRLRAAVAEAAAGRTVRFIAELGEGAARRRIDLSFRPITDETGQVRYILPEGREITDQDG